MIILKASERNESDFGNWDYGCNNDYDHSDGGCGCDD